MIHAGRLSPPLITAEASVEEIGLFMGGLHGIRPEAPAEWARQPAPVA